MKKMNLKMALFTSVFIFVIIVLFEFLMPDKSTTTSIVIAGVTGFVSSVLARKLFPNEEDEK